MIKTPIKFVISHRYEKVKISDEEVSRILDIASWKQTPFFLTPGRCAWHILKKPASFTNSIYKFRAVKLKGVGIWNPKNRQGYSGIHDGEIYEKPHPPTTSEYGYTTKLNHVGFNESGEYSLLYSNPAPYGGIIHDRALLEYKNAKLLIENNIPSIAPLVVIKYKNEYIFQDHDMGAVISLSPDDSPSRLHSILFCEDLSNNEKHNYYNKVCNSLGIQENKSKDNTRLETICLLCRKLGKTLHDFGAVGLFRYSSGFDNVCYCPERKVVFLTDLDSSLNLSSQSTEIRPLQLIRDLASALYKFLFRLSNPNALYKYKINQLLQYDPLFYLISGYFPDTTEESIRSITKQLWNYFIHTYYILKRSNSIPGNWQKNFKM